MTEFITPEAAGTALVSHLRFANPDNPEAVTLSSLIALGGEQGEIAQAEVTRRAANRASGAKADRKAERRSTRTSRRRKSKKGSTTKASSAKPVATPKTGLALAKDTAFNAAKAMYPRYPVYAGRTASQLVVLAAAQDPSVDPSSFVTEAVLAAAELVEVYSLTHESYLDRAEASKSGK